MQSLQAIESVNIIAVLNSASRRPKQFKPRTDPFSMDDEEFRRHYRFSKSTINAIIDLVHPDLQLSSRGKGTPTKLQVLTAVRCWGRREVQEDAGDHHGLSQPTVSRICNRVARALARHSAEFIKMPTSFAEEQKMMKEFMEIKLFPSVIGCIDCTHIKIKKCGDAAQYCNNRKGFSSLNVQVTCDARLVIRDFVARWRGSTHDSRIFNESTIKQRFEAGAFRGRLLGDSGYRLEPYLLTPILRPQNPAEERYNEAHIATRNCVKHCFGVWKQRFQCLLHGMTVKLENVKTTIVALAVLHNIAMEHEDSEDLDSESSAEFEPVSSSFEEIGDTGARRRNGAMLQAFIIRHFGDANQVKE